VGCNELRIVSGLDLSEEQDYIASMLRLTRKQQQQRLAKAEVARVRSEGQT
jgi:hypothetical protein